MIHHLGILNLVLRFLSWWWHPINFEPCHLKWEKQLAISACGNTGVVLRRSWTAMSRSGITLLLLQALDSWLKIGETHMHAYLCIYVILCVYIKNTIKNINTYIWRDAMQILGHHYWREMAWVYLDSPQNRRASKVSKRGFILIPALM